MRRTSSLDAIYYNKGARDSHAAVSHLFLSKSTQTPEEWASLCESEVSVGCSDLLSDSPTTRGLNNSNASSNGSRRTSIPSLPWPQSPVPINPIPSGENMEKYIRQKLQQTNKEMLSPGHRYSPIPADHSVFVPISSATACNYFQQNSAARSSSIPQLAKPLRSSIEELNQEIENLVLKPHNAEAYSNCHSYQQDGRVAPIPDYFRCKRNVNTQTPLKNVSTNSSAHSSPYGSPISSPLPIIKGYLTSPSPEPICSKNPLPSPRINKFLAREPPDGCEKVQLRLSTDKIFRPKASVGSWPQVRPSAAFTLLPSLRSAFYAPDKSSSNCRNTTSHSQGDHASGYVRSQFCNEEGDALASGQ